jgi:hypothetical protein
MGSSGMNPPKDASESYFVAAEGTGFDVPHPIVSSGNVVVSLFLETTRVVGTVDSEGFLTGNGLLHPDLGTLASTLVLTIRAQIDAGLFGTLGSGSMSRPSSTGAPLGRGHSAIWWVASGPVGRPSSWTSGCWTCGSLPTPARARTRRRRVAGNPYRGLTSSPLCSRATSKRSP